MKYGVTVGCIPGDSVFINALGTKISVGVCCWYFGNLANAEQNKILYGLFGDYVDPETIIANGVEDEDDEDYGLRKLFAE